YRTLAPDMRRMGDRGVLSSTITGRFKAAAPHSDRQDISRKSPHIEGGSSWFGTGSFQWALHSWRQRRCCLPPRPAWLAEAAAVVTEVVATEVVVTEVVATAEASMAGASTAGASTATTAIFITTTMASASASATTPGTGGGAMGIPPTTT